MVDIYLLYCGEYYDMPINIIAKLHMFILLLLEPKL